MPQSYTKLIVHIIFSTKHREAKIVPEIRPRLHGYMRGIIEDCGGIVIVVNGMADHVHLLLVIPPERSVSEMVRLIKSNSSKWLHEQFPMLRHFGWQNGYSAFSVSESNLAAVRAYIASQEEHHRKRTFTEELSGFLKKHGFPALKDSGDG